MKRIFTLLFAAMLAGQAWAEDFTVGDLKYTITGTNTVSVGAANKDISGNIDIPEEVENEGVTYTVTNIGDDASFYGCSKVTSINIPQSVVSINSRSFLHCGKLTEINVESGNTKFLSENGIVFSKDRKTIICYPHGKTDESYSIPNTVTEIGNYAFAYCNLKTINIPESVTSIGEHAFIYCFGFESITFPNSLKSIGTYAFGDCGSLKSVIIPNSVTYIGSQAFAFCDNLESAILSESITNISNNVFGGGEKFVYNEYDNAYYLGTNDNPYFALIKAKSTDITSCNVNNRCVLIAEFAFQSCDNLTSISIPESLRYINFTWSFFNCDNIQNYNEYDKALYWGNDENPYVALVKAKSEDITSCEINSGCKIIFDNAFKSCGNLTSISIPNSVVNIGDRAFASCYNLKSLIIPNSVATLGANAVVGNCNIYCVAESQPEGWNENWNSSNNSAVWGFDTNLSIFNVDIKINDIFIGSVGRDGYKTIGFFTQIAEGYSIELIAIPNDGYRFVKWSNGLIDDTITVTVTSDTTIQAVFASGHITRNGLHYVTTSRNTVELEQSDDYKNLTEVIIPDTIMVDGKAYSVTSIGSEAFKNCSKLTSVTFPNTLTTIGNNAFENCTGLLSVKIPTSVTTIGNKAYYNCTGLQWILIPKTVTSVGEVQFLYCDDLTIFCEAESKPEGWDDAWNSARSPVVWGFDTNLGIYMVTVAANNKNYGTVSGSGTVVEDSVVTITATPAEGYRFAQWSNGLTNATETITVTSDTSLVALFAKIKYYDVTVKADDSEHGTVAGGGNFAEGSEVTITAEPGIDYRFVRWSNGQTNDTITITVNSNISLVAEFAEKDLHYEITSDSTVAVVNSDEYIWRGKITIPETVEIDGKTYTVTSIGDMAFQKCAFLESVVIPNTVTSLGYGAFERCGSLLSITLPDHLAKIGQLAFAQCSELPNIIIPISVDTVDARAFFQCSKITVYCEAPSKPGGWSSLWDSFCHAVVWGYGEGPQNLKYEITSSNTVKVVRASVYEMLTEIEIPETIEIDGTTYTVTAIDDAAFAYCSKLKSVVIPNTVTDLGTQAFMGCDNLTSVTMSNSITSIGQETFANSGLTTIDIPIGVTSIGRDAFTNCHLTSVAIPTTTTSIEYEAFSECADLQTVIIPNSVTSITKFAFINCFNLTIYCESDTAPETWAYDWNFSQCPVVWGYTIRKAWTVSLSANNSAYGRVSGGGAVWDGSRVTIVATPAPGYRFVQWSNGLMTASATITVTSDLTLVAEFAENTSSETWTVTLSADNSAHGSVSGGGTFADGSVITITATPAPGYRFVRWSNDLTTATAHITVTSDITLIADFEPVTMYEISLSANNSAYGSVSGGGTFADGTTITIKATPAEGYRFVQWSNGLTTATATIVVEYNMNIMAVFTPEQTSVGYLQYEITSNTTVKVVKSDDYRYMTEIVIPETVEIDGNTYSVTSIGEEAFKDCSELSSVTIPNSVKTIESWAFYRCYGLKSVTIPNSVERILYGAFENCSGLESITIPEGVTFFDNCVFEDCDGLTSITIPESVTSIPYGLFEYCDNLTTISLPNTIVKVEVSAFEGCNKLEYNEYDNALYLGNAENPYVVLIKTKSTDITSCEINSNCKVISGSAFKNCKDLTSITVPNSVENIGYCAFSGCSSLESITLPFVGDKRHSFTDAPQYPFGYIFGGYDYEGGIATTQSYYYGDDGYVNSTYYIPLSLKSVVLTDCDYIQYDAFDDCDNLTSITIPTSVTQIEGSAFSGCGDNLTIYCDLKSAPRGWDLYLDSYNIVWGNVDVVDANNVDGDFAYRIIDGTNAEIIDYVGSDSVIVIPSAITKNGIQYTVTRIGDNAFKSYREMQFVTIPNTVTSIGNKAFSSCYNLKSVEIPNSVKTIGSYTFEYCGGLTSVVIPNSVTTFGKGAFYNCYNLTSVEIPNSITNISNSLFSYCSNLNSVTIPTSVTNISKYAFSSCGSLATVDIPASVTNIEGSAFIWSGLTHIAIPSSVTSIDWGAFRECNYLTAVTIPNSVTSIGSYVFYECPNATIYCEADTMPEKWDSYWNPDSCPVVWGADINSIFYLTVLPSNYEYGSTEGSGAFFSGSLATIAAKPAIGYSFVKWSNGLTNANATVTVTSNTTLIADFVRTGFTRDYYYFTSDSTVEFARLHGDNSLKEVVIPDTVEHYGKKYAVTSIDSWAFEHCDSLISVTIPNTVTSIENGTFYNCTNLKSITIPGNVTSIGEWAFVGCSSLTDVTISEGVTSIGELAFRGCSSLTSVVIPEGVTSIGKLAFGECYGLKSITIPSTVTSIGGNAFSGCDSLTKAEFASIESLCGINFVNSSNPLSYAKHLYIDGEEVTDLVIPNTVTKISDNTFSNCNSLTSVTIPKSVTTIDDYAFYWCDSLKLVIIPASVTSIGFAAFGNRDMTFYCEAESQPEGWNDSWNLNYGSVVWDAGENLEFFKVLVATDNSAYGSVQGGGAVVGGYTTKITATPTKGYHFTSWSDGNTKKSRTITVTSDTLLTALFEAHTAVVDSAVAATCTEKGKSEGSHCSVCGEVIVAQKTIPALGHEFVDYIYNNDATTEADGTETAVCEHGCGATDTRVAEGTRFGTAVAETAANAVSIYAYGNIIVVENATDEISVYDAMGRLVGRDAINRVRTEIRVKVAGIYIVKVGNSVKRVMVND